ncbi:MAG: mandelate racemase, partial [Beijerinckiaceae bacterium]|nr:mandelate racemase [Beijerinckiaceae bacterium]
NIRSLQVRAVDVPLDPPVKASAGAVTSAPLVLIDLLTEEGITGRAYIFTYTRLALGPTAALLVSLEPLLKGQRLHPTALSDMLHARFRLLGTEGLLGMALAGIDMAAWDALARAQDMPLCALLGADPQQGTPAYASLRGWEAAEVAAEAEAAMRLGFRAVKLKFGHKTLAAERAVFDAVRKAVENDVAIFVDPNQAFTVPEAIARAQAYADWGVAWLEEPIRADDLEGHAAIRRAVPGLAVQRGENDWGPNGLARSISAGASGLLMPDAMKIGGVTGWMRASALAQAAGIPVSSHLFIEASAHLLAATPQRHYLEWLDIAAIVLADGAPSLVDGLAKPSAAPGIGLAWNEQAVTRYAA